MSTYYCFYPARKNANDKIELIGNFINDQDGKPRLQPIIERSRSFIDWDDIDMNPLSIDDMDPKWISNMTEKSFFSDNPDEIHSIAYYLPLSQIQMQSNDGVKRGYMTLEDVNTLAANNYCLDDWYYEELLSADVVAEMNDEDRKKYGHTAFIDTNSKEYIYNVIATAVDPYEYNTENFGNLYIVCLIM